MRHVAVVGASLAGVHAAESLREAGFEGDITLIGAEDHPPYDRPPLSKESLRLGPSAPPIPLRQPDWYADRGITVKLGVWARGLDPRWRRLRLSTGAELGFDGLVIATGSVPRPLPRPGGQVHLLRTLEDCARLHRALRPGRHLAVVGAGFIGLEVAATARAMGLEVTVVEQAPVPLSRVLGDEAGRWFAGYHAARGVDVRCGVRVEAIEPAGAGGTLASQ